MKKSLIVLVLLMALGTVTPLVMAQCVFPYTQVDMGNLNECYPTKTNNPGHGLSGIAWLGPCITGETQPPVVTERDCFGERDLPPLDACTDGVAFFGIPWQPCTQVTVAVLVSVGPNYSRYVQCGGHLYLDAWQDGNLNGNFDDNACTDGITNEWIIQDQIVTPGLNLFSFKNPFDPNLARPVQGMFRFRLLSHPVGRYGYGMNVTDPHCPAVLGNDSLDFLGEVEDYNLCDFMLFVDLVSFQGTPSDNAVDLSWVTASETQNDHFEIMRDGASIARIAGNNGGTQRTYTYSDPTAINGVNYHYSLVAVDVNGARRELGTAAVTPMAGAGKVTEYNLAQNYPNPFNPTTSIRFDLVTSGFVSLKVYNMVGQEVATLVNGNMELGHHSVSFDATNLPSGLYLYRIEANGYAATRKMLLLK